MNVFRRGKMFCHAKQYKLKIVEDGLQFSSSVDNGIAVEIKCRETGARKCALNYFSVISVWGRKIWKIGR